jgi:hypothetical protein
MSQPISGRRSMPRRCGQMASVRERTLERPLCRRPGVVLGDTPLDPRRIVSDPEVQRMKHLLSGVAIVALLSVGVGASAQTPMSPSTAAAPPGGSPPAASQPVPPPATSAPPAASSPAPSAPPAAAAPTKPPAAAAAATPSATAPRRKRPVRHVEHAPGTVYHPRGMSDNIANQLNAQQLNQGAPPPGPPEAAPPPAEAMAPYPGPGPGPGYPPPPPGYPPPPPGYPAPAFGYPPPPPAYPPPWGYPPPR